MSTEKLATKSDLQEMYSRIRPYLGGSADAGFTPIGTIIAVMGNSAPANYLVCNGQTVNIADYPELANYFLQQFGSKNKFGGNGTTTFGIPDLRGEFLRGTGTNSHTDNGNGSAVGTHQDGTKIPQMGLQGNQANILINYVGSSGIYPTNGDGSMQNRDGFFTSPVTKNVSATADKVWHNIRPTNTSVLFCIATKNIYLNPSMDYSTDEKVVGTWIGGETIYQKTISCGQVPQAVTSGTRVIKEVTHGISNIDRVISLIGSCYKTSSLHSCEPIMPVQLAMNNTDTPGLNIRVDATNILVINSNTAYNGIQDVYATIQYTKTTS